MKSDGILRSQGALLASVVLLVGGCSSKDAELAAQRQKELEAVRAELEQIKTSAATQESELTRLRKDNLELLRLRNEVRQLRDAKKQLSQEAQTAQAQAERAQAQVQAVQSQAQQAAQALATQQQVNACINNLRLLQGAKQQWALEHRKPANAVPLGNELSAYLKGGVPRCPLGGTYNLNSVGAVPTCTTAGHALPQ